jgi:hypothetical protein
MHVRRTLMTTLVCLSLAAGARAQTIAIAGFDYTDTSGEVRDQSREHAGRLADFLRTLQAGLTGPGLAGPGLAGPGLANEGSNALILGCAPSCTAKDTAPEVLLASAREVGATRLVYGGIHKVSTLIQEAIVQMVDIEQNRLVLDRRISFRGDTDDAWRHAAAFAAASLRSGSDAN